MREKTMKLVVTFHTTTAAMAMETACMKAGFPGRLIPVPRAITAGCGMAWMAPVEAMETLKEFTKEQNIAAAGFYQLML